MSVADIYQKLFKAPTEKTSIQIFRYFLVGVVSIAADFALLIFLTEVFNMYYLLSAALGFLFGMAVNYVLTTLWVFNRRKLQNRLFEIGIYALTGFLGLALTEVIIWVFTDLIHFHYVISKTISFVVVYLTNFFIRKALLF